MKQLTEEQVQLLNEPLPAEAVTPHPTKKFLSNIKSIYVTERLNKVFGTGAWTIKSEPVDKKDKMIVIKTTFEVPQYQIYYECYGGNDNPDLGDAYKGAVTDAITKIGSWLGIGAHIWKNEKVAAEQKSATAGTTTDYENQCHALISKCNSIADLQALLKANAVWSTMPNIMQMLTNRKLALQSNKQN